MCVLPSLARSEFHGKVWFSLPRTCFKERLLEVRRPRRGGGQVQCFLCLVNKSISCHFSCMYGHTKLFQHGAVGERRLRACFAPSFACGNLPPRNQACILPGSRQLRTNCLIAITVTVALVELHAARDQIPLVRASLPTGAVRDFTSNNTATPAVPPDPIQASSSSWKHHLATLRESN